MKEVRKEQQLQASPKDQSMETRQNLFKQRVNKPGAFRTGPPGASWHRTACRGHIPWVGKPRPGGGATQAEREPAEREGGAGSGTFHLLCLWGEVSAPHRLEGRPGPQDPPLRGEGGARAWGGG